MPCTNNHNSNSESRPAILLVGGWSAGPLEYLYLPLVRDGYCIVQPAKLPMPPFGCGWCWHPKVILMLAVLGLLVWLSTLSMWVVLLAALWGRILAAIVVRASIQTGVNSCLEAIRPFDRNQVVLIGFSWGGAVLAELLAQGKLGDHDHKPPPTLLIAPTTSLVASIAYGKDAALRINLVAEGDQLSQVVVVHGLADATFCPNQDRWKQTPGVFFRQVRDNHIFMHPHSQQVLTGLLRQLLEKVESGWGSDRS